MGGPAYRRDPHAQCIVSTPSLAFLVDLLHAIDHRSFSPFYKVLTRVLLNSFIPVVVLALVFNFTNVIGFTYA